MAFPQDVLSTKVEIWYDEGWNEITSDVRGTGAEDGEIEIDPRGQPDETTSLITTQATLSVNNKDGKYSPRNLVSPLYGKIGMNTPLRIITDVGNTKNVADDFSTSGTNGWPNADSGHVWTSVGTASSYLTSGNTGIHRHPATAVELKSQLDALEITDFDCVLEGITLEALPTGAAVEVFLRGRISNGGADYIHAVLTFFPSNTVQISVGYTENNVVFTQLGAVLSATATDTLSLRFRTLGRSLYIRGWKTNTDEPTAWDFVLNDVPVVTPGKIMVGSVLLTGNTNTLPFDVSYEGVAFNLGIILFTGEISEWPKRWDKTGGDVWVPLQVAGLTRRLLQGDQPLHSALYRHYVSLGLCGYWSFENMEGPQSAYPTIASDLEGGASIRVSNPIPEAVATFKWSDESTLVGSDPLPSASLGQNSNDFGGFGLANLLPAPTTHNAFSVSFWNRVILRNDVADCQLQSTAAIVMQNASPVKYYLFTARQLTTAGVPSVEVYASGYSADLTALLVEITVVLDYDPRWRHFHFSVQPSGADLLMRAWVDGVPVGSDTLAAVGAIGQPASLETYQMDIFAAKDLSIAFGHVAIATGITADPAHTALGETVAIGTTAYAGETDAARIFRLCAEEGINYVSNESPDDPLDTRLGPQRSLPFMELIQAAARAGDGTLFEMREDLGYRYTTRWAQYGKASSLTLDYANTDLSEVPESTDDDQRLRNKIIVTREGGTGSIIAEQTEGRLSTNDPRAAAPGSGLYQTEYKVNLFSDEQLPDYAGWRLRLGTWDESRFPGVSVALHRTPFTGNHTKFASAALLDIAEILTIVNPPPWLPPDNIVLQMRSVKIFLSNFNWGIDWNCLPGRPWTEVATATAEYGRVDTAGSHLVSSVDSDDIDLIVLTEENDLPYSSPQWTEDLGELDILGAEGIDFRLNPQSIKGGLGGERVRATVNRIISDGFSRSGQLSGSTADTGQTWVNTTGTAANATTDGTKAVLVHTAANTELRQSLPGSTPDMCIQADVSFNIADATGAQMYASLIFRQTDVNNYYQVLYELSPGSPGLATIYIIRTVAGSGTNLSVKPVAHASAATVYRTKVVINNGDVLVKIWDPATETEGDWTTECRGGAQPLLTGNDIALRSIRVTGNTNTNPAAQFDNLTVHTGKITPIYYDRFARTVASGLGSANVGGAYTTYSSGGSVLASDYNVSPNAATVLLASANSYRGGYLASVSLQDLALSATFQCPLATGAKLTPLLLMMRGTGSVSSFSYVYVDVNTDNSLTLAVGNTVQGVLASSTVPGFTHSATVPLRLKGAIFGNQMLAKLWDPALTVEPAFWLVRATAANGIFSGWMGWRAERPTSNTNTNPTPSISDFRVENPQRITVQRGMDGISRAWDAETDVRLWTPARLGR